MKIFNRLVRNMKAGFTLIELLVVISIIGILATLLILQLNTQRQKGRDIKRVTAVTQIQFAIESYFDDNNAYPAAITTPLLGKYMKSANVPVDPLSPAPPAAQVYYGYAVSGLKYQVWAELEQKSTALSGDDDVDGPSVGLSAGVVGSTEACTATANDCLYDLGSI